MKLKIAIIDFEIPPRAKRWAIRLGIPVATLTALAAVAYADLPKTWNTGDPLTAADLNNNFAAVATPPGTIIAFAGISCPQGTVPADGNPLPIAGTYSKLYAAIGTTWGAPDATHFSAPNLLNRYLRGAGTPSDNNGGTPVAVGQYQEAATRVYTALVTGTESASHTHGYTAPANPNGEFGGVNGGPNPGGFHTVGDNYGASTGAESTTHTHTVDPGQGDTETRPKTYGVLFCVYY
jgi:hypothetical protein